MELPDLKSRYGVTKEEMVFSEIMYQVSQGFRNV